MQLRTTSELGGSRVNESLEFGDQTVRFGSLISRRGKAEPLRQCVPWQSQGTMETRSLAMRVSLGTRGSKGMRSPSAPHERHAVEAHSSPHGN
jgi:hypothetical protein